MTYASEGDNVTLCWRIVANSSIVSRYYVRALSRPVESVMDPVGSANGTGYFEKVYPRKHDGNYINRATVIADLSAGMVYLKITNYTKKMDNVYCVHYQSRLGMNDLTPCHSQALLLRNIGEYVYLKCEYAGFSSSERICSSITYLSILKLSKAKRFIEASDFGCTVMA